MLIQYYRSLRLIYSLRMSSHLVDFVAFLLMRWHVTLRTILRLAIIHELLQAIFLGLELVRLTLLDDKDVSSHFHVALGCVNGFQTFLVPKAHGDQGLHQGLFIAWPISFLIWHIVRTLPTDACNFKAVKVVTTSCTITIRLWATAALSKLTVFIHLD